MATVEADDPVSRALADVADAAADVRTGRVADYIPELARADPEHLGVAAVSVLGRRYTVGAADVAFTIQSISKPFVLAIVLADLGLERLAGHVGFEPSGEPFNAISLDERGRPANPMINAGAIVTSALVEGAGPAERFERIRAALSAFAGRPLALDERVYASEDATGDRNRALAFLTAAAGVLPRHVDDAVEVYFRQCSLEVTAVDLATMAATLANRGVNPLTGEAVVDEQVARSTLSLMASCGMYDFSGEWMVRVGLPAKSGVGGGIAAAKPGQFGIGVFSPPLDDRGNSSRGVAVLEALSSEYDLHLLAQPGRPRSPFETRAVPGGERVVLRGELDFLAAEQVAHHLVRERWAGGRVELDLGQVTRLRPVAERLLARTARDLAAAGVTVTVDDPGHLVAGLAARDGATLPVPG